MTDTDTTSAPLSLSDAGFKAKLQELRQTDNVTNWYYIARTYLYLALVLGGAVWFFEAREVWGVSWWWNVPVALVAIVLVGAGQHQLAGWPTRGRTTSSSATAPQRPGFRPAVHVPAVRQHLPLPTAAPRPSPVRQRPGPRPGRIADARQRPLARLPAAEADFLVALVKQLWPLRLIRFMRVRAKYNATGTDL
jgi:hypothetical protein